jgi:hypothetical protein
MEMKRETSARAAAADSSRVESGMLSGWGEAAADLVPFVSCTGPLMRAVMDCCCEKCAPEEYSSLHQQRRGFAG